MAAPASSAYIFHNRFASDTSQPEASKEVDDHGFNFQFKDFTDFSPTLNGGRSDSDQEEKGVESSHLASPTESHKRPAASAPNHVATLEAAVENNPARKGNFVDSELERKYSSSASMYSNIDSAPAPVSAVANPSGFQQAINGYSSRSTLPRPPMMESSNDALEHAVNGLDLNGRGGRTPEPGMYGSMARIHKDDSVTKSRPSSFFGLDKPLAEVDTATHDDPFPSTEQNGFAGPLATNGQDETDSITTRGRRSSFFGMEQPMGHIPNPDRPSEVQSQAARIAASHRNAELIASTDYIPTSTTEPLSSADSSHGGAASGSNSTTRPASIAPTLSGPLLDHSHLKPGLQAALLSHNKTLELYRQNAKKTNDPNLIYEFAVFMVDASKSMGGDDSSGGTGGGSGTDYNQGKEEHARDELAREAIGLLKKIAERGHMDAQYYLADCYANGIGTVKGKQDFDKAYPLFVLAAKHGHSDAAYRAGTCYEKGWGCRKDVAKALQFYRKAASQTHPGAMYRLATAELNGDLGLKKSAREGVKWLKRSAESATPEFPHALHELALLHERGVDNVLFLDEEYACELLAQAAEMGYAPSAYKLGVNYEYGRMGCPQDGGLSIHMYNIAAQQNHKEACFALTAWYLVGAPGILPQSDTEAYLWAKKAAEQGLAKAEYAVGYFTEMGIGTVRDLAESRAWYRAAAEHGDKRANQRLTALGGQPVPMANQLAGAGSKQEAELPGLPQQPQQQQQQVRPQQQQQQIRPGPPGGGAPVRPVAMTAKEQGERVAAEHAHRMIAQAEQARQQQLFQQHQQQQQTMPMQPSNAPFNPAAERNGVLPNGSSFLANYPSPMAMRDPQIAQREHALQMAINQQHLLRMRGSPAQSSAANYRGFSGSDSGGSHHQDSFAPSIYSSHHRSMSPPSIQSHRERPPRQGSIPPPNFPPGKMTYPSYPGHMSAADSYSSHGHPPRTTIDSPPPPPNMQPANEKKKSLWTQLKQI